MAPPVGFTDLSTIPDLWFIQGYANESSLTGERVPGYGAPAAWLRKDVAAALAAVQADLRSEGLGLVVYDAYQPSRAALALVAWAARHKRKDLMVSGAIARHSPHSSGTAVDVGLVDLALGVPLDMGGSWGAVDGTEAFKAAEWPGLYNREVLRYFMRGHGFRGAGSRWWHYQLPSATTRPRDVPYGCHERAEGEWRAPRGWHRASWEPTRRQLPSACPDEENRGPASGQTK
jgi:D-alanyl-D-alanine dipeptidase